MRLESEFLNGINEYEAKDIEGIKETTDIAHPFEQAVGLSLDLAMIRAEIEFVADKFKSSGGLFFSWICVPSSENWRIICKLYEISLYIIAKLHKLCFILQSVSLDAAFDFTWIIWIELDVL